MHNHQNTERGEGDGQRHGEGDAAADSDGGDESHNYHSSEGVEESKEDEKGTSSMFSAGIVIVVVVLLAVLIAAVMMSASEDGTEKDSVKQQGPPPAMPETATKKVSMNASEEDIEKILAESGDELPPKGRGIVGDIMGDRMMSWIDGKGWSSMGSNNAQFIWFVANKGKDLQQAESLARFQNGGNLLQGPREYIFTDYFLELPEWIHQKYPNIPDFRDEAKQRMSIHIRDLPESESTSSMEEIQAQAQIKHDKPDGADESDEEEDYDVCEVEFKEEDAEEHKKKIAQAWEADVEPCPEEWKNHLTNDKEKEHYEAEMRLNKASQVSADKANADMKAKGWQLRYTTDGKAMQRAFYHRTVIYRNEDGKPHEYFAAIEKDSYFLEKLQLRTRVDFFTPHKNIKAGGEDKNEGEDYFVLDPRAFFRANYHKKVIVDWNPVGGFGTPFNFKGQALWHSGSLLEDALAPILRNFFRRYWYYDEESGSERWLPGGDYKYKLSQGINILNKYVFNLKMRKEDGTHKTLGFVKVRRFPKVMSALFNVFGVGGSIRMVVHDWVGVDEEELIPFIVAAIQQKEWGKARGAKEDYESDLVAKCGEAPYDQGAQNGYTAEQCEKWVGELHALQRQSGTLADDEDQDNWDFVAKMSR